MLSNALEVDHLVIAATSLDAGAAWCEATLGVALEPGGRHPKFGTHNRLLDVSGARHPRCYLEILAVDPDAPAPLQPRWFGLDEAPLQRALRDGPRLVAWAARVKPGFDLDAILAAWREAGCDPGPAVAAERATPRGLLRWRLTVRPDGRRLLDGALPALIAWGDVHPSASLTPRGVTLASVAGRGWPPAVRATLGDAVDPSDARDAPATGAAAAAARALAPQLRIVLDTPRGRIVLDAPMESSSC
jgi:hypothetical protein